MKPISTLALLLFIRMQCDALASTPATSSSTSLPPLPRPPAEVWPQLVVGGKEDPALGRIEENQRKSGKNYGRVLDAGTGIYSLRWLSGLLHRSNFNGELHMSSFVAVTADENFRRECQYKAEELGVGERAQIVKGNWNDHLLVDDSSEGKKTLLCEGQLFDTILADYLVGAVDHFSPFFQDQLFFRLRSHLKSGGVMHLTGLNPIPEKVNGPANIFCKITKLRDACILLAGSRPYRGTLISR